MKRSLEDRELCDEASKRYEVLMKRVDDLEAVVNRAHSKHTVFDDIFKKINGLVGFNGEYEL